MREAFYLTTFNDVQAINDPRYVPRGGWRYGPFSTYDAAAAHPVMTPGIKPWTHFKVDKMFVKDGVAIRYIDQQQSAKPAKDRESSG